MIKKYKMLKRDCAPWRRSVKSAASPIGEGIQDLHNQIFSRLATIYVIFVMEYAEEDQFLLYRNSLCMGPEDFRKGLEAIENSVSSVKFIAGDLIYYAVVVLRAPKWANSTNFWLGDDKDSLLIHYYANINSKFTNYKQSIILKEVELFIIFAVLPEEAEYNEETAKLINGILNNRIVRVPEASIVALDTRICTVAEDYPVYSEKNLDLANALWVHREKCIKGALSTLYFPKVSLASELFPNNKWYIQRQVDNYKVFDMYSGSIIGVCNFNDNLNLFVNSLVMSP